ncbi:MAG: hypothetical protein CVV49_11310 [Spirochaetae bacterium HGW-Spirochaetae-5]|nr:MAG: hypothetical protein CVV49_11310 [Spirochaetae bacterium HGW-Spirochaetae-5]
MKFRNKIILVLMLTLSQPLYALDMKSIVAYPVPFNPEKTKLIVDNPAASFGAHKVLLSIFDVNGDMVLKKTLSAFPVYWNGRNGGGRLVKPGLYIIKIEIDDDNGDYGKKIIRILVDY